MTVNDGTKNVPFTLPDEEEEDVFSSVEVERDDDVLTSSPPMDGVTPTGGTPSVSGGNVRAMAPGSSPSRAPAAAGGPNPILKIDGPNQPAPRTVEVGREVFNIGGEDAHLSLDDEYVSKWHAQIRMEDGAVVLTDLGSKNGVFLRIADDLQLEDHDEIVLGQQRFVFRTSWDAPVQETRRARTDTPSLGGNLPSDAARLIQMYTANQIGSVSRIRDRLVIGRQNADLVEPDDPQLSSPHATIERRGTKFFIKDARSQHGTYIRVLDSVELIDGDCFLVGRSRISISYP